MDKRSGYEPQAGNRRRNPQGAQRPSGQGRPRQGNAGRAGGSGSGRPRQGNAPGGARRGSYREAELQRRSAASYDGRSSRGGSARSRAKKKRKRTVLFIVEIVVLIVLLMALYLILKGTQTTRFDIKEEDIIINDTVEENEVMKGYRNIALFGVDARDDSLGKGNRSDTIMIASINQDTGEVRLVSVFRDTYLNLGNDSYSKCNSAYSSGGPEQAMNMLNKNLDMNITDYVTVGFTGVQETVDALGGVEIDVKESEIEHLNSYQISMVGTSPDGIHFYADAGKDYTPVTQPGLQTLNGLQATAYCRIRYVGNDFERTARQRRVLLAMAEKAKNADIGTLNKVLDSVFPHVATNLTVEEIAEVLKDIGKYNVTESEGFPFEDSRATGTIGRKGSCIVPLSLESNVVKLHKFLFDEDYETSSAVKEYSAKIESDTKAYVGSAPNNEAPAEDGAQ